MSVLLGRCGRIFGVGLSLLLVQGTIGILPAKAEQPETVIINLDHAHIERLPDRVATIVLGNPLIADATLQSGGVLVVTGKGYGETNLLALDRAGQVLLYKTVRVLGPSTEDIVVVYRGVERETYSCASSGCERRITLGDSPAYFNANLTESTARTGQAQGSAQPR
jgi:Flp pilus assembly secretin CpaC